MRLNWHQNFIMFPVTYLNSCLQNANENKIQQNMLAVCDIQRYYVLIDVSLNM